MKKVMLLSFLLCVFTLVNAQVRSKKHFVEISEYSDLSTWNSDFFAVSSVNKDTLFLLANDQLSRKLIEVWYSYKDKPVIIYVSYNRLFKEYVKQNWALKPKEESIGISYGKCN